MIRHAPKSTHSAVPLSLLLAFAVATDCRAANDNMRPQPPDQAQQVQAPVAQKSNAPDGIANRHMQMAHLAPQSAKYATRKSRRAWTNGPTSRIARANTAARAEPSADQYINAIQIYPYSDGTLYRLYAAVGRISDIKLEAGESLIDKAAGDTVRWVVGDTTSGAHKNTQTHVLVKPIAAGLKTNLLITTTRRTYHLELVSTRETYMASLSWHYPQSELPDRDTPEFSSNETQSGNEDATPLNPASFNFDYDIDGPRVAWRPIRVFDNGRQTFIQFAKTLDTGETAPLFITDNGKAALVNYRQQGNSYTIDRLFDAAELRLGTGTQQIVRIRRTESKDSKAKLRTAGVRR
jgi:type IV secretion system protein TrbG